MIDIVGQRFNDIKVLKKANRKNYFVCNCELCGKQFETRKHRIIHGEKTNCGCINKHIVDLSGVHFGLLTVKKLDRIEKHKAFWLCECKCGKSKVVKGHYLIQGWSKSCGCLSKHEFGIAASRALYGNYKRNAIYKDRKFDLSFDDFIVLTSGNCFYCGIGPQQSTKMETNGQYIFNGIDRIDNEIGYQKNNCVSCCEICNKAKRDIKYSDFNKWLKRITKYQNEKPCIY